MSGLGLKADIPSGDVRLAPKADICLHRAPSSIQGYCGPEHKIMSISDLYSALVQALKEAREKGQGDRNNGVTFL
jgi:hypothetical protein